MLRQQHQMLKAVTDGKLLTLNVLGQRLAFFELRISPVLRQDQDIWNFYGSLTLNNGKLI